MFNHGISSRLNFLVPTEGDGSFEKKKKKTHKGRGWVFEGTIPKKSVPALI